MKPLVSNSTANNVAKSWHQMDASEVLEKLGVNEKTGLSESEVRLRQAGFGRNELMERGSKSPWAILADQLTGIFVIILMLAGFISIAMGDRHDAIAIFAIVLLNAILGFAQEFKAEKAIAALKQLAVPSVSVRRNGELQIVNGPELVPGDILSLEAGNIVPADCRLLETRNLRVQEAALTGEPEPVEKQVEPIEGDVPVGDRRNMAYAGTSATYGRAVAVVTETGMRTELGRIAEMLQAVKRQPTPLQRRLDQLARHLALVSIVVVGVIFAAGLVRGDDWKLLFLTSISLLVAAVPEGLPAVVTIALALGTQRMLRRRALVRKLTAVETLGSVSVICSDKTGTLTENRMTVALLDVAGCRLQVAEHVRARKLELEREESATAPILRDSGQILMLTAAALCNDATLQPSDSVSTGDIHANGDPTEAALVVAAAHFGLPKPRLDAAFPRVQEVPFDSNRKRMTTVHRVEGQQLRLLQEPYSSIAFNLAAVGFRSASSQLLAFTKGAVDSLIERSSHVWVEGQRELLDSSWRNRIENAHEELARTGMRVLGFAVRAVAESVAQGASPSLEEDLTFIGMMGMSDPPRDGVRAAIEVCRDAGIRTVMITGDHPATANQIAHELDISRNGRILTGQELSGLSAEALAGMVEDVPVYARVTPEDKLKIVAALQQRGHVVAMTGDGVNDAPALKKSNIGVTMGIAGTDVSKEAADMVLLDDNFTTIVAAVEEGRVIYDNLRKFIKYALSGNVGEICVMLLAPLVGMPLPLLPLQILWINLVTDGLPGLAYAVEPAERNAMKRPPSPIQQSIFGEGMAGHIVWIGVLVGLTSLAMGYWYWQAGRREWQTIVFTTLTLSQMANALAIRSSRDSLFRMGLFSNKQLVLVVAVNCLLQVALIYTPFLQKIFATTPLTAVDLFLTLVLSTSVFWAIELQKYFVRRGPAR